MAAGLAVVTGASGGIGRAIASRLSKEGYRVLTHYAENQTKVAELVKEIRSAGGLAWGQKADLSRDKGIDAISGKVRRLLLEHPEMELRALVNNAGLMLGPQFGEARRSAFDAYFAVNTRAPLLLTQELAPLMPAGGSVVNISSAAAHFASPGDIVYAMSKSATESFTRHAAPALARAGIRINTVIPGFTDNGHPAFTNPLVREHMSSFSVLGDVAQPSDVAAAVSFLLSGESARTTGSVIDVSGGSTIAARPPSSSSLSLRSLTQTL